MTEKEKRTILDMRAAGKQYKEISAVLGIEVSALKVFVHRQKQPGVRKCAMCGKRLPDKARASQRFCSVKCKNAWWKKHTVPEIAIMPQSEKREQQHPGGVMPLFSLPESPHPGRRGQQ